MGAVRKNIAAIAGLIVLATAAATISVKTVEALKNSPIQVSVSIKETEESRLYEAFKVCSVRLSRSLFDIRGVLMSNPNLAQLNKAFDEYHKVKSEVDSVMTKKNVAKLVKVGYLRPGDGTVVNNTVAQYDGLYKELLTAMAEMSRN